MVDPAVICTPVLAVIFILALVEIVTQDRAETVTQVLVGIVQMASKMMIAPKFAVFVQ